MQLQQYVEVFGGLGLSKLIGTVVLMVMGSVVVVIER